MKKVKFNKNLAIKCNSEKERDVLSEYVFSQGYENMPDFSTEQNCYYLEGCKCVTKSSIRYAKSRNYPIIDFKFFKEKYINQPKNYKLIHNRNAIILIDTKTGNKGIARCSEGDEFDFSFGVSLAKAKLEGRKYDAQKLIEDRYGDHEIPVENNMIPAYENTEGKFEQGYTRYKNIDEYIKDTVVASGEDVKLKLIEYIQNDLVTIDTKAFILNILSNKNFINKTEIVGDNSYRNCALSINYDKVRVSASGGLYKAKPAFTLGDIVKHFDKNAEKIFIYLDEQKYTRMFRW